VALVPANFEGVVVLWFDGSGKRHLFDASGKPTEAVSRLLEAGQAVVSGDLFQTGEFLADETRPAAAPKVNSSFPGYTYGYNRPLIAERVHDIESIIGGLGWFPVIKKRHLIGTGDAGLWVLLANSIAGDSIDRCAVDLRGFGFGKVTELTDPNLLPGGLKYGGVGGLAALSAPRPLSLFGVKDSPIPELSVLQRVYQVANGRLSLVNDPLSDDAAVAEILK
jgi:hypothetical protein